MIVTSVSQVDIRWYVYWKVFRSLVAIQSVGAERVIYLKENNMKRMSKTAIALATAGALGFAVVPMADAQTERPTHQRAADSENDLTAIPNADGADGEAFVSNNVPTEGANPDSNDQIQGTPQPGPTMNANVENSTPTGVNVEDAVKSENPYPTLPPATITASQGTLTEQPGESFKESEYIKKTVDGKTQMLFVGEDGKAVWHTIDGDNQPVGPDGKRITGLKPAKAEDKKDVLPIVLGVLGGLAGLGLVIAGVNYWVNKDGNLVTDPNKVNEPSSPADAENTKKIVAENTDEVAKQLGIDPATGQPVNNGQATGGERGIGAATGVNKIPAALLSLLLASVLGAAAFVFGRRQLV